MSKDELYILSFYRASELAGALLFGRLAMHTNVNELRAPLTEQCSEEAKHAWMITQTIQELGEEPLKITETFQSEIAAEFGMPSSVLEVLGLTQVFEERVLDHYRKHIKLPGLNPKIKVTLESMLEDEEGHVDWIQKQLNAFAKKNGQEEVDKLLERVKAVDEAVIARFASKEPFKTYFKELI